MAGSCFLNVLLWFIISMALSRRKYNSIKSAQEDQPDRTPPERLRNAPTAQQPGKDLPPTADVRTCLYCGKKTLTAPAKPSQSPYDLMYYTSKDENGSVTVITDNYYKCGSCGVCCSAEETDKAEKALKDGGRIPDSEQSGETEILSWAWKLMQANNWEKAQQVLYKQSYPFENPLEFIFCRKICCAAPLLDLPGSLSQKLSLATINVNCLKQRYEALDPLADTLNCLNRCLPADDSSGTFRILRRLCELLRFFNGLPFKDLSTHADFDQISDYTHKKRLEISYNFASFLESRAAGDPEHRAAYLSLAADLLQSCSSVTIKVNKELRQLPLDKYGGQFKQISRYERELLDEEIERFTRLSANAGLTMLPANTPDQAMP